MPQVLLVNPSPRAKPRKRRTASSPEQVAYDEDGGEPRVIARKGKSRSVKMATRKKPRSAAQRAATKKLIASNRKRRAPARRAPAARAPARRKRRAPAASAAPTRRRRRSATGTRRKARRPFSSAAAASKAGRTLRYRRRNPIGSFADIMDSKIMPAAYGAGGALLLDVALGLLPLPATLKVGPMAPVVKVAGAIGLGMAVGKVAGKRTGDRVAVGALTVTLYNIGKGFLRGRIPGLSDGEYMGEYIGATPMLLPDGTIGEYIGDDMSGDDLGYIESGMQVGGDEMSGFETGVYR
jgi:hypothetical protein